MGYDSFVFRTTEPKIDIVDNDIQADEVLYLRKAYWLGAIAQKLGVDKGDFYYLTKDDMEYILDASKRCLKTKDPFLVGLYFGDSGYIDLYDRDVFWYQLGHFNRVVANLLRNQNAIHYWYLK